MAARAAGATSIRARLALLYGVCAFVMLLVSSLAVYALVKRSIDDANVELVASILPLLTDEIEEGQALAGPLNPAGADYLLRVTSPTGRVRQVSPGAEDFPFPRPTTAELAIVPLRTDDGRAWVVGSLGMRGAGVGIVQIATDVTGDARLLLRYQQGIAVSLAIGLVLSGLVGHLVAMRGLRPLREIAVATERITVGSLHQRLAVQDWPGELVQLVHAINRMLDGLEDGFRRLSSVAYDMAHELRTPINNLVGEASVALARERGVEEYRAILASSLEECERLSRILDALLFLARVEHPQHRVRPGTVDAAAEVAKVLAFHEPLAEESGLRLDASGGGTLRADATLLGRALANLVGNAIKHTPPGGRIDIAVAHDGPWSTVTVSDTGPGIPQGEIAYVFDRFYRTAAARDLRLPGTGLGLAIVKSIMDWHGGTVSVTAPPAGGTRVVLAFPRAS